MKIYIISLILFYSNIALAQNNNMISNQNFNSSLNMINMSPRVPVIWYTSDDRNFSWDISLRMLQLDNLSQDIVQNPVLNNNIDNLDNDPEFTFNLKFNF